MYKYQGKFFHKKEKIKTAYVLLTGPSLNNLNISEINKGLIAGNTVVIVANSFFYKDIGLINHENIFFYNVDPIQLELYEIITSNKNILKKIRNLISKYNISKEDKVGILMNLKSLKSLSKLYSKAKIVNFVDIRASLDFKRIKLLDNFVKGSIILHVMHLLSFAWTLDGWKRNYFSSFFKPSANFQGFFKKFFYAHFLSSVNNSFYQMMDLAKFFEPETIHIAGRNCELSNSLIYINGYPHYKYYYFYSPQKNIIPRPKLNPEYIIKDMLRFRQYLDSFEKLFKVKLILYSSDIWALDRSIRPGGAYNVKT